MTNQNIRFSIQISPTLLDSKHAFRLYRASMTPDKYELGIAFGVIALLFGILLFPLTTGWLLRSFLLNQPISADKFTDLNVYMPPVFIALGIFAIFDLIPSIRLWFKFRHNSEYYSEPVYIFFGDEEIRIQEHNVDIQYKWDFFKIAVEGNREFILVFGNTLYFPIPKRAFQNQNEIEEFRVFLQEKFPNFKQKFKVWLDFQR